LLACTSILFVPGKALHLCHKTIQFLHLHLGIFNENIKQIMFSWARFVYPDIDKDYSVPLMSYHLQLLNWMMDVMTEKRKLISDVIDETSSEGANFDLRTFLQYSNFEKALKIQQDDEDRKT
ncbi:hypothetical protein ACJX0J_037093, partial [Zea mays]